MAIVPITVTSAMTWRVSIVGNIHVDSAIVVPSVEYSIRSQRLVGSGYIKAPLDRCVGDPATAPHDHAPENDEQKIAVVLAPPLATPLTGRLAPRFSAEQRHDHDAEDHQDHLDPEVRG